MRSLPLTLFLLLAGCPKQVDPSLAQREILPAQLGEIYLGQPMLEVAWQHGLQPKGPDAQAFRITYDRPVAEGAIGLITYYFDVDLPGQPLYELILAYESEAERDAYVERVLGPPNHGDQWIIDVGADWPIRAWTFQNKLIFAAWMPGTEWNPHEGT